MGGMQTHLRLRPAAWIEEHCHDLAYRSNQETLPGRSALRTKQPEKALVCSQDFSQDFPRIRGQVRERSLFVVEGNRDNKWMKLFMRCSERQFRKKESKVPSADHYPGSLKVVMVDPEDQKEPILANSPITCCWEGGRSRMYTYVEARPCTVDLEWLWKLTWLCHLPAKWPLGQRHHLSKPPLISVHHWLASFVKYCSYPPTGTRVAMVSCLAQRQETIPNCWVVCV